MNRLSTISNTIKGHVPSAFSVKVTGAAIIYLTVLSLSSHIIANSMMKIGISKSQTTQQIDINVKKVQEGLGFKFMDMVGKPYQIIFSELEKHSSKFNLQTPDKVVSNAKIEIDERNHYKELIKLEKNNPYQKLIEESYHQNYPNL